MRSAIPVVLCMCLIGCASEVEESAGHPADYEDPTVEEDALGPSLARIDGDYIYPRFSPSGDRLAYAEVIRADGGESTQIWVWNLESDEHRLLLSSDAALKYAVYSAYVTDLEWHGPDSLVATISDGDVDQTAVTFSTREGKVLSEFVIEAGFDELGPASGDLHDWLTKAYADWPGDLVDHVARQAIPLGPDRFVVQKRYAGEDSHLWVADLDSDSLAVLMSLPDTSSMRLIDGIAHGGAAVLVLGSSREARVLFHSGGELRTVLGFSGGSGSISIERRLSASDRTVFLLKLVRTSREGTNYAMALRESGVERIQEVPLLFDVDASADGRWVALNRWEGGRRRIEVVEIG